MRRASDPVSVTRPAPRVPGYLGTATALGIAEERRDGKTTLVVPSGPVPAEQRGALARQTALPAAAWAAAGLLLALVLAFALLDPTSMPAVRRAWAGGVFGVLGLGAMGVVWRANYETRLALLTASRLERTTFDLHPDGRLFVEVRGPVGHRSYDLPAGGVWAVQVLRWIRADVAAELPALPLLLLHRADAEPSVQLLSGRDVREIEAVAAALASALNLPAPDRPNRWRRPVEWLAGRHVIQSRGRDERTHRGDG
jgi:hypothetical protein